jgi:hypothetical protein
MTILKYCVTHKSGVYYFVSMPLENEQNVVSFQDVVLYCLLV